MADQAAPGAIGGAAQEQGMISRPAQGRAGAHEAFHGRPVSWVAVSIIMAGFLAGGIALVFGPTWWLFWVAAGMTVVGGLLALATNIFEDWY